jgi:hypothetical protein
LARGAAQGNLAALLLTLLGVLAVPLSGDAQAIASHAGHVAHTSRTDSAPEAAFVGAARAATARYRDIAVARADGYRRVGGELPSLGEHWVHNARALADTLDPAAPPILVYATIDGRATLAGVAYTRFLAATEAYPDFPRGIAHAWHDHNGDVDDEVLPLGHIAGSPSQMASTRLRIAVMHAWIWVANPGGLWASDNWGLPYARLGLPSDAGDGGADARALSLASGGEAYYLSAIVSAGGLDAAERERVGRLLSASGARATTIAAALARGHDVLQYVVSRADRDALDLLWTSMWDEIARSVRPDVAARLVPLRDALTPASVRR